MPAVGLRRICPHCASADIVPDSGEKGGTCKSCGKRSAEFLEMRWADIAGYKRTLRQNERLLKFSFSRCDEVHAIMLILLAALLLIFFIYLVT